jgi:hypothetical protein
MTASVFELARKSRDGMMGGKAAMGIVGDHFEGRLRIGSTLFKCFARQFAKLCSASIVEATELYATFSFNDVFEFRPHNQRSWAI